MATLFCCSNAQPYKPQILSHEPKFSTFLEWVRSGELTLTGQSTNVAGAASDSWLYAVQVVKQVNYGPIEWKKYFAATENNGVKAFYEIQETDLLEANYEKLNAYKNFKCATHNKFFELNIYQKNAVNEHHWRVNIARPASDIDIMTGQA